MTLSPSERNRGDRLSPSMRCFSEILNELGLRDLPLQGGGGGLSPGGEAIIAVQCLTLTDSW